MKNYNRIGHNFLKGVEGDSEQCNTTCAVGLARNLRDYLPSADMPTA